MFLKIGSNIPSMVAQRRISETRQIEERESVRLSSGDRISRAAYDPSGLAISETMRARSRSFQQATRNTNDGVSLLQIADGSLGEIHSLGARLKELAIQSSTETYNDSDRANIEGEFSQLLNEVKRITKNTEFNGNKLLDGSSNQYDLQVGIDGDANSSRMSYDMKKVLSSFNNLSISGVSVASKGSAQASLSRLDTFIDKVSKGRAYLGSFQTRLHSAGNNLSIMDENIQASRSKIRDTDYANSTAERVKAQITQGAATTMLKQTNIAPENVLKLIG
tara:strand:- start:28290 stop:29123 length:834 start_codon:yes stop_codon:yes gene_type:complete